MEEGEEGEEEAEAWACVGVAERSESLGCVEGEAAVAGWAAAVALEVWE